MKNLAAIFLFGVALVALCGSFSGTGRASSQVQYVPQVMRVANTVADGNFIPVANDRNHPLYAIAVTDAPASYAYSVLTFSPPVTAATEGSPAAVDLTRVAPVFEAFLNSHADWEPVNVPTRFAPGVNLVVFRHRR